MINLLTFSSLLTSHLTDNIMSKLQESIDDFFKKLSEKYKKDIQYLQHDNKEICTENIERYLDGTIKTTFDYWDILSQEEKEEAINLMDLYSIRTTECRNIRKYLMYLAGKAMILNTDNSEKDYENFEETYELIAFTKFLHTIPECIKNDVSLLTKPSNYNKEIVLNEKDLYQAIEYSKNIEPKYLEEFIKNHRSEEIENIINSFYALDLLVDF